METMRTFMLLMMLGGCLHSAAGAAVPWGDGEKLVYEVHWGMVVAAEAKMSVASSPRGWEAVLELRSRGMVDSLYPIESRFVSGFDPGATKSFGLEGIRNEGGKAKHHRLILKPEQKRGTFENVIEKSVQNLELPTENCQDVFSTIFAARTVAWGPGVVREWDVCEKHRLKRIRLKWEKDDTIRGPDGKKRDCWVLDVEELPDRQGKAPKKPLRVKVWVEKGNRQPLRADLRAVFGTFRLTRVD